MTFRWSWGSKSRVHDCTCELSASFDVAYWICEFPTFVETKPKRRSCFLPNCRCWINVACTSVSLGTEGSSNLAEWISSQTLYSICRNMTVRGTCCYVHLLHLREKTANLNSLLQRIFRFTISIKTVPDVLNKTSIDFFNERTLSSAEHFGF